MPAPAPSQQRGEKPHLTMVPFFMLSRTQCWPWDPSLSQYVSAWLSVKHDTLKSSWKRAVNRREDQIGVGLTSPEWLLPS